MRVLIVSSSDLFCQCLTIGLADQLGVECVESCRDAGSVAEAARSHRVTSILVDLREPEGAAAIRLIGHAVPDVCVLALSVDDSDAGQVLDCARLGCHGIVPRDCSLADVARIIGRAERGVVAIRPEVGGAMMRALAEARQPPTEPELIQCLTRREREICNLAAEGMTNKEIARQVNRSEGTVKNHLRSILAKLELPRRGALGAYVSRSQFEGSATPFKVVARR